MRAKMAKGLWACACWLSIVGAGACDGSGGGGSAAEQCSTERDCRVNILFPGGCDSPGTPTGVSDEGSAQCALEHLRDGKVAFITIEQTPSDISNPGYCGDTLDIHVEEDRTAIVAASSYWDLQEWSGTSRDALKAPGDYQKCLDDGPATYASCLLDPLAGTVGPAKCACEYCE